MDDGTVENPANPRHVATREDAYGAMVSKDLVQWMDVTSRLSMQRGLRHRTSTSVPPEILENLIKRN